MINIQDKRKIFNKLIIIYIITVTVFYGRDYFLFAFLPVSVRTFYPPGNERDMLRAVVKGDIDKMEELIDSVDVNQLDRSNSISYLLFAYLEREKQSFSKLLEYGASPDISKNIRHTFSMSTDDRDSYYMETLLKYPENFKDYVETISGHKFFPIAIDRAESLRRYRLLYDYGADPDRARPTWPVTPIRSALIDCDYDRVLILLDYGAIFNEISIEWLIEPPYSQDYKERVSSATREDVVAYLSEHYDLDITLKEVVDESTGEVIK